MSDRNPALDALEVLVGEWRMTAQFGDDPPVGGGEDTSVVFEWMPGRMFLVERSTVPDPVPDALMIVGLDPDDDSRFVQHYFDARGVARVYRMSLTDRQWRLWRDEADFSPLDFRQRYTGDIADDGRTITGAWEICEDGKTWAHDFSLSYAKVS
jgi:hypothetical protein